VISVQPVAKPESTGSEQDKSIAADIDSLPVLLNDFDQAALSASLSNSPTVDIPQKNQSFLEDVIKNNNGDTQSKNTGNIAQNLTPAMEKNPFVTQAENLLQSPSNSIDHQLNTLTTLPETTASTTTSFNDKTAKNDSPVLINPLEAAIKNSSNSSNSSNGVNTSIPMNNSLPSQVPSPNNSMGYIPATITNQQPNLYPNINTVQTSQTGGLPASGVSSVNSVIPNNPYPVQSTNPVVIKPNTSVEYRNYSGYGIQPPTRSTPSNLSYPGQVQGQYQSGYGN